LSKKEVKEKLESNITSISNKTADKRLSILSITWGINAFAYSIVYPFLPIYLHTIRGIPMSKVGLIYPIMGIASIVSSPVSGFLTDKLGSRPIMIAGPIIRSIAFFVLAAMAAMNANFFTISIGLFFTIFFGTFFQNASNAYITALIAAKDRTIAFSKVRVGLNVGWMVGPAIGSFLARTPFSLLFTITATCCIFTSAITFIMCPSLPAKAKTSKENEIASKVSYYTILKQDQIFTTFLILCLLIFVSVSQFITTLSIFSTKIVAIDKTQLGYLYTLNGAIVIALLIPVNKLLKRIHLSLKIGVGALLYGTSFLCIGLSQTWLHLVGSVCLLTLGEMISVTATISATGQIAKENTIGRYMGLLGLTQGIGWAAGPYFGSLLFEVFATSQPFLLWQLLSIPVFIAGIAFICLRYGKSTVLT
jgi:MFS family permease